MQIKYLETLVTPPLCQQAKSDFLARATTISQDIYTPHPSSENTIYVNMDGRKTTQFVIWLISVIRSIYFQGNCKKTKKKRGPNKIVKMKSQLQITLLPLPWHGNVQIIFAQQKRKKKEKNACLHPFSKFCNGNCFK